MRGKLIKSGDEITLCSTIDNKIRENSKQEEASIIWSPDKRRQYVDFISFYSTSTNFVCTLTLTKSSFGVLHIFFYKVVNELWPLMRIRIFFSAQFLEKELTELDEILYAH